jgi:transposase
MGAEAARLLRAHLRFIDRQIKSIDATLEAMVLRHASLGARVRRLRRVNSIGPVSSLTLVAFLPELGRVTDNQAAALAGLAPYNNDSGKSGGPRAIRGGRARIRTTLYMAAVCATRSNPILREFYARLIGHGKPAKVALTAVMRKLVVLANRIIANPEFNPS